MDVGKSSQSMGRSKESMELIMDIQPKDTSRGHFLVSLVKSLVRIGAGSALIMGHFAWAGGLLIFAEILGIVEELV